MKLNVERNPTAGDVAIFSNIRNHKGQTHFIAESEKIVTRLLHSKLEILSFYLTESQFEVHETEISAHDQQSDCTIFIGSNDEMEAIIGFSMHQGILAAAKIPKERSLGELISDSGRPLLIVILDEIADAENMGAMIRTSQAIGTTVVVIDKKSVSPWMRRAVRVSMGGVFDLPILTVDSLLETLSYLKAKGIPVYAATLNSNAHPIWSADLRADCAIVLGSEGHGIKPEIIEVASKEIRIPMRDDIHSLNVGIAHGIIMFEASRQRNISV
ncbi:MAG: RNA methyltransferase [Ignavibacteriota bacterium]